MTDRKPYQSDEPLKANTWWQCGRKTLFEKEPSVVTGWGEERETPQTTHCGGKLITKNLIQSSL